MTMSQEVYYKESIAKLRQEWDTIEKQKREAQGQLTTLQGSIADQRMALQSLTDEARRRQFRLDWYDEMEARVSAGGAIALSEFIVLKTVKTEAGKDRGLIPIVEDRLWIKVIDVKKGYWAEAPFTREVAIALGLKLAQEQMTLVKERKQK